MILDTNGKNKITILIVGIIILVALIVLVFIPEATVTITFKKELFKKTYPFTMDYALQAPLPAVNRINAKHIKKLLPNHGRDEYVFIQKIDAAVPKKSIEEFLAEKIKSEIDAETKIIEPGSLTYTITLSSARDYVGEIYTEASIVSKINPDAITRAMAGKKIGVAREYLNSIPSFTSVSIQLHPRFLFFIPFITKRIHIIKN